MTGSGDDDVLSTPLQESGRESFPPGAGQASAVRSAWHWASLGLAPMTLPHGSAADASATQLDFACALQRSATVQT